MTMSRDAMLLGGKDHPFSLLSLAECHAVKHTSVFDMGVILKCLNRAIVKISAKIPILNISEEIYIYINYLFQ